MIAAPASEPLRRFLQVARGAGLRVSAAEGIDAARAVDIVGFSDRVVLKDTLGLLLAKTPDEKPPMRRCSSFSSSVTKSPAITLTIRRRPHPALTSQPRPRSAARTSVARAGSR